MNRTRPVPALGAPSTTRRRPTPRTIRALAPALVLLGVPMLAAAQTVIVRGISPTSSVEVVVNTTAVGMAQPDAAGDARIPFDFAAVAPGRTELEATVHVDACGAQWRVLILGSGIQAPPPDPGCERRDIMGLFVIRPETTVVVNAGSSVPTLLLLQGSVDLQRLGLPVVAPTGLMLFGGGGFGALSNARDVVCGLRLECTGSLFRAGLTAGVLYWITPNIGAEAAYVWAQPVDLAGGAERFSFDSSLDPRVFTIVGKLGGRAGRTRIYGQGGVNRHEAVLTTNETINDFTVGTGDPPMMVPGGSWTGAVKTTGWGWVGGGGVEAWMSPRLAIYVEGGILKLNGTATEGEATLDDRSIYFRAGARLRLGG